MTLIAAWLEHGAPTVVGDVLITRPGSEEPHIVTSLPSRTDVTQVVPTEFCRQIVGLRRKVYTITNNLAVAWSGTRIHAQAVLSNLSASFKGKIPSIDDIKDALGCMAGLGQCKLVGAIVDKKTLCFSWDSTKKHGFRLVDSVIEGSALEASPVMLKPNLNIGSHDTTLCALSKLANPLAREVIYGDNLQHAFGGGFELHQFKNGCFRPVEPVTYLFFLVREEQDGSMIVVPHSTILKVFHENEILYLFSAEIIDQKLSNAHIHAISGFFHGNKPIPAPKTRLSLRSSYYTICVEAMRGDIIGTIGMCSADPDQRDLFIIEEGPDGEHLIFTENLPKEIARLIHDFVPKGE
jgi:hypothetical protein